MPDVEATLEFLQRLPLYETEKPYLLLPLKGSGLDPEETRLDNLEYETHGPIHIREMRGNPNLTAEKCGFEFYHHETAFRIFDSPKDIDGYRGETEKLLTMRFAAARVLTYEVRLRKNHDFAHRELDIYDKLLVEGPAKGAHVDVTWASGPQIIRRYLPETEQAKYLRPGFRVRIYNTWRPLNDVLEDRPLAICDSRSINPEDLTPADRILPDRVGEVYYLHHASSQEWYWLEQQRNSEPFIFLMYDTQKTPGAARFCPHVSFDNPRKPDNAEPRSSIETRSVVITADDR